MTPGTRQQMIAGAAELLARRGVQATSFSELLAATGTPRGSLYHHFPGGKNELLGLAVRHVGDQVVEQIRASGSQSVEHVARSFVSMWRAVIVRSQCEESCPVAAVAIAAVDEHADLRDVARAVFRDWERELTRALERAGMQRADARRLALALIATMEGGMILARAAGSVRQFDAVVDHLLDAARAADDAS